MRALPFTLRPSPFTFHLHASGSRWHRSCLASRNSFALNAVIYTRAVRFNRIEFALVLGIAFGLLIHLSITSLLGHHQGGLFANAHLTRLLSYELIVGTAVAMICATMAGACRTSTSIPRSVPPAPGSCWPPRALSCSMRAGGS